VDIISDYHNLGTKSDQTIAEELKEIKERYKIISEQSFVGMVIEQDTIIKYVNETLSQITEYSVEEMYSWKGNKLYSIIHPDDISLLVDRRARWDKGEKIQPHIIFRITSKSGEMKWLEGYTSHITYKGRSARLSFFLDVTARIDLEKEKLKTIFEAIPDLFFLLTEDTTILEYKSSEEYLYLPPEDFLNKKLTSLMPPDLSRKITEIMKIIKQTHKPQVLEYELPIQNEILYYEARFLWFPDNKIGVFIRNITDRKNIELELRRSEERFRTIFENAKDGMIIADPDTKRFLHANDAMCSMIGYSLDELTELSVPDIHPVDKIPKVIEAFEALRTNKIDVAQNLPVLRKDGIIFYADITGALMQFDDKILMGGIFRDITKRFKAEKDLMKALNQTDFYKDLLSHDINNNLQKILLLSEFGIKSEKDPDKLHDTLEKIRQTVLKSGRLISTVQKLSKIDEFKLFLKKTHVKEVLEKGKLYVTSYFPNKTIEIEILGQLEGIFVNANEFLLDIFENLLHNAVKYSNNEKIEVQVRISKVNMNATKFIKIEFIDNGPGITNEAKNLIFKKGHRFNPKVTGMGLGLSLVKNIVESHNGEISIQDKVPGDNTKGSNFVLLLPEA